MAINVDRMIRHIANAMPRVRTLTIDDYISAGHIGMLRAKRMYDPDIGTSYVTYAWRCAQTEMWHLVRQEMRYLAMYAPDSRMITVTHDDHFDLLLQPLEQLERTVLAMRYRDLYTQREIADAIGSSQSTVHRIEHVALSKLRKYYM